MAIIAAASSREDQMHIRLNRRRALQLGVVGAVATTSLPALAHHGWNWAEDQQSELSGTVKSVSMAPPHPSLQVTASDGKQWLIDLANPNQTERSGFTAASAKPIFKEALTEWYTQMPVIPSIKTIYTHQANTTYWEGWPTDDNLFMVPNNWWGQFMFVVGALKPAGS